MRWTLNNERMTATHLSAVLATIAAAAVVTAGARGQTPAAEQLSPKTRSVIPPPRPFTLNDLAVGRAQLNGQPPPGDARQEIATPIPPITPLPASAVVPDSAARPEDSGHPGSAPAASRRH